MQERRLEPLVCSGILRCDSNGKEAGKTEVDIERAVINVSKGLVLESELRYMISEYKDVQKDINNLKILFSSSNS
ncbi:hypothetical protein ZEAMMB73_Zm00001d010068 [Zea mays]|uniref:Uncharacterized protein n=1 Tax=Zea mays TaxID=4577 RepID=A0A1D6FP34_MAIZE|nr:hypothetical protein ZEAMMB73_Zm00001d010068 [Zea mays]